MSFQPGDFYALATVQRRPLVKREEESTLNSERFQNPSKMESVTVIALLLCCCFAAADPRLRQAAESRTDGIHGFKIAELPKPAPGFYLNRQFQKQRAENGDSKKPTETKSNSVLNTEYESGYYLNRQFQKDPASDKNARSDLSANRREIIDTNGRRWVVAEPVQPEPGFYLNRQFINQRPKATLVKKDKNNEVFLLRGNSQNAKKAAFQEKSVTVEQFSKTPTEDKANRAISLTEPNFYTLFPAIARTKGSPVVEAQIPEQKPDIIESYSRTSSSSSVSPSFILRQRIQNQQGTGGSRTIDQAQRGVQQLKPQQSSLVTQQQSVQVQQSSSQTQQPSLQAQGSLQQSTNSQDTGFSCDGKPYGYYADTETNCKNYHICNPISFSGGFVRYYKYSFTCSSGLQWDQSRKVCVPTSLATSCQ